MRVYKGVHALVLIVMLWLTSDYIAYNMGATLKGKMQSFECTEE